MNRACLSAIFSVVLCLLRSQNVLSFSQVDPQGCVITIDKEMDALATDGNHMKEISNVDLCVETCIRDSLCVAVDYNSNSDDPFHGCWTHLKPQVVKPDDLYDGGGTVDCYIISRDCPTTTVEVVTTERRVTSEPVTALNMETTAASENHNTVTSEKMVSEITGQGNTEVVTTTPAVKAITTLSGNTDLTSSVMETASQAGSSAVNSAVSETSSRAVNADTTAVSMETSGNGDSAITTSQVTASVNPLKDFTTDANDISSSIGTETNQPPLTTKKAEDVTTAIETTGLSGAQEVVTAEITSEVTTQAAEITTLPASANPNAASMASSDGEATTIAGITNTVEYTGTGTGSMKTTSIDATGTKEPRADNTATDDEVTTIFQTSFALDTGSGSTDLGTETNAAMESVTTTFSTMEFKTDNTTGSVEPRNPDLTTLPGDATATTAQSIPNSSEGQSSAVTTVGTKEIQTTTMPRNSGENSTASENFSKTVTTVQPDGNSTGIQNPGISSGESVGFQTTTMPRNVNENSTETRNSGESTGITTSLPVVTTAMAAANTTGTGGEASEQATTVETALNDRIL